MAGLEDDYANAGFSQRLGFGARPALIIVDFVMAYLDPDSPLYAGVEAELETSKRLLDAARAAAIPVFWSNVEYEPGGGNGGQFYRKIAALSVFDRGSALGAFPEKMAPIESETVITKQYPSAFFGTSLSQALGALDIDCCVIAGLTTSGCVRATALDALQNDFIPIVVEDACGDRDQGVHQANIFDLGAKYADIVSTEEAIAYFSRF
jgi:nicotinamidase-related amidase